MIPFETIREAALAACPGLLFEWFPAGVLRGNEFIVGSLDGEPGRSLSVNIRTGKWADFAGAEKGGDLISLFAAKENITQAEGAKTIGRRLGVYKNGAEVALPIRPQAASQEWAPIFPPPPGTRAPTEAELGRFDVLHEYRDADGEILMFVRRIEARGDRRKQFYPLVWGRLGGRVGWQNKNLETGRPLYGLDRLAARPTAPVIIHEGEKAADGGTQKFPDHVSVSWPGGAQATEKTDWSPLAERDLIIWPDNDANGIEAAAKLAARFPTARVLRVDDLGDGDDAADVCVGDDPAGWLLQRLPRQPIPEEKASPEGRGMMLPAEFFISSGGVFYQPSNDDAAPVWVCDPIFVAAETQDGTGNGWGLLLKWKDRDGAPHQWAMPRKLLHADGKLLAAELADAGLRIGTSKIAHERLKQFLSGISVSSRILCVDRTGWHAHNDAHVFVLSDAESFGPNSKNVILQGDRISTLGAPAMRGTLGEWQDQVARFAVGNHRLGLFMSCAFAGPLLEITAEPSGGLHLHGVAQSGKTTALAVAASVWGRADAAGVIRTWRATANGLEGVAAQSTDGLLALDEISAADGNEVGDIIYQLANEGGKVRAHIDGSARRQKTWRTIFISTGEQTVAAKMAERGKIVHAGQDVRLTNIAADAGAGLGVFQELHGMRGPAEMAAHLREVTRCVAYGTAARAFLDRLATERAKDPAELLAFINDRRQAFLEKILPAGADGQVISVARRFGLIAAAGELAISFKILPWPKNEALLAAAAGFRSWLAERGGPGAAEDREAVRAIRLFIEQHEESRFRLLLPAAAYEPRSRGEETRSGRETINRVGFRREMSVGGCEFLIFPEAWKSEVCKGLDPARAAAALHAAGFLERGESKNWAKKHRVPGIPGSPRFYTINARILSADG